MSIWAFPATAKRGVSKDAESESGELKLTKIAAIMLGVRNLSRSVAFYRDKLGLVVKEQTEGFAFLDGGVTLALSEPLAKALGPGGRELAGVTEVVFSVDGVREAYEALSQNGVVFTREPHAVAGPQWVANFEDPDRHRLAIFGPEGKS